MTTPVAAYLDEASVRVSIGHRVYGIAAALTTVEHRGRITESLHQLVAPGRSFLHHYDEPPQRRIDIAEAIAELPLHGAIILTQVTSDREQERARARILRSVLPRLQHDEGVSRVVIESRQGGDKHDRRLKEGLRRSRHITGALWVDHANKRADPLVWLPDFIIGSYFAARHHDQDKPWQILNDAHVIDVVKDA